MSLASGQESADEHEHYFIWDKILYFMMTKNGISGLVWCVVESLPILFLPFIHSLSLSGKTAFTIFTISRMGGTLLGFEEE